MAVTIADITPRRALDRFRDHLGLSELELAAAFGVSSRTISRWRKGEAYPQHDARAVMNQILALSDLLDETFDSSEAARTWMRTDNRYLGGMTPREAVRAGRTDRALLAIKALEAGVYL